MSHTAAAAQLPTIVRTTLRNGQAHYTQDGAVHTNKSNRHYTHASVYRSGDGSGYVAFLHSRADLAAKGHKYANPAQRVGTVEIVDGDAAPALAVVPDLAPVASWAASHDSAACALGASCAF